MYKLILIYLGLLLMSCAPDNQYVDYNTFLESETQLIDPCGDGPGQDEILLVFENGNIVAWYLNLGLVDLGPGQYVTTDSQQCRFEITEDGLYLEEQ